VCVFGELSLHSSPSYYFSDILSTAIDYITSNERIVMKCLISEGGDRKRSWRILSCYPSQHLFERASENFGKSRSRQPTSGHKVMTSRIQSKRILAFKCLVLVIAIDLLYRRSRGQ